jgi:hypothetical protein
MLSRLVGYKTSLVLLKFLQSSNMKEKHVRYASLSVYLEYGIFFIYGYDHERSNIYLYATIFFFDLFILYG